MNPDQARRNKDARVRGFEKLARVSRIATYTQSEVINASREQQAALLATANRKQRRLLARITQSNSTKEQHHG